jgi:hypothetical protein
MPKQFLRHLRVADFLNKDHIKGAEPQVTKKEYAPAIVQYN